MTFGGGKVLVTHPGRQHSHQAAMALNRAGLLSAYWAGVPSRDSQQGSFARRMHGYPQIELPDDRARWMPVAVGLRRLGRAAPRPLEQAIDFLACRAFDRQAAWGLRKAGADAVMACEISALSTFRAAKRLGMPTILDVGSPGTELEFAL